MPKYADSRRIWPPAMRRSIAIALAACLGSTSTVYAQNPASLDIRLDRSPSEAFTRAVAALAQPAVLRIQPDETFITRVEERCGRLDPVWVEIFLAANPGVRTTDLSNLQGSEFIFPACVRPPADAPVELAFGDAIERLFNQRGERFASAQFEAFAASAGAERDPRTLWLSETLVQQKSLAAYNAMQNALKFAIANPGVDPSDVRAGDVVRLPTAPVWSNVILRPDVSPEMAAARLATVGGSSADVRRTARAELIHDADAGNGQCLAGQPNWPMSPDRLRDALARNAQLRNPETELPQTKILVLDTGVDREFITAVVPTELQGRLRPFGTSSGGARYLGVNLARENHEFTPPTDLPNRSHGGEVISALMGLRWLPDGRELLTGKLKVAYANVATEDRPSLLSARAIANVLEEARRNEIDVINVSLSASEDSNVFARALDGGAGEGLVFVAAAGNDSGRYTSGNFRWLAGWGGNQDGLKTTIITVGAHDQSGRLLDFSRRGLDYVDILAPGCAIPVLSGDGEGVGYEVRELSRAGTSYAAPQVSLIVALLRMEELSPKAIKARLAQSADYDPALENEVWSAGRLNPARALGVYEDHLTYISDGVVREIRGRLTNSEAVATLCGDDIGLVDLRKLARSRSARTTRILYWIAGADVGQPDAMKRRQCESGPNDNATLNFTVADRGGTLTVELADIVDYTPRRLP